MKRSVRATLFLLCAATCAAVSPASAAEDAKAYYNRGTASYETGDYEAAITDLSMAIALEPKAPDIYFNRGMSYRRQHRIEEAISDFSNAIILYPQKSSYYFERCNARIVGNDFDGAIADCSEALHLSPEQPELYFMRGLAYMLSERLDEAFTDSSTALRMDPTYKDAIRLLFETILKIQIADQGGHPEVFHASAMEHKGGERIGENFTGNVKIAES